jgi:putative tryptophan/tyrosine transport system substrate-binding protein
MRRREFVAGIAGAAAWPLVAWAQQPAVPVIGFLSGRSPGESSYLLAAFRQGLSETGFSEGRNVTVEYRWAEGELSRLDAFAAEMIARRVAVVATVGGGALRVTKSVTTIPVVFLFAGDPVEAGLVTSFSRPLGNVTGATGLTITLDPKRMELLRGIATGAPIAVLVNPNSENAYIGQTQERYVQAAAKVLGGDIHIFGAGNPREIDIAFRELERLRPGALLVAAGPFFNSRRDELVALSAQYRIPTLYHTREFVEAGGLMSYGSSIADGYRQLGLYVGRILNGAKPSDLTVMQPTKFELLINLKTAKALGLTIPETLLATADEVIE